MIQKSNIILTILIFMSILTAQAKNLGHRAGGGPKEYWKSVPENSLLALEYSLIGNKVKEASQNSDEFLYLEFDVQETYDHKLVIFHDEFIKRMIPNSGYNKAIYSKILKSKAFKKRFPKFKRIKRFLTIKHFTYEELRQFRLKGEGLQSVPTFKSFLELSKKLKLKKPMSIEIKKIRTRAAKEKLISMASHFYHDYMKSTDVIFAPKYDMPYKVGFLTFPHVFYQTFGFRKKTRLKWCDKIVKAGLHGVFKPGKHNNQCLD